MNSTRRRLAAFALVLSATVFGRGGISCFPNALSPDEIWRLIIG